MQTHLSGIHNCADAHCEGLCRYLCPVSAKEPSVGDNSVLSQGFDACSGHQGGAWLIESDVAISSNTWQC